MNDQVRPPGQPDAGQQPLSSPLPAKHTFKPLRQCRTLEEAFSTSEFRERIEASVPQHVQPNRMLRCFVQAAARTPKLYETSVRSFVGACLTLSQVGLEPNTPLGHGYLIPFNGRTFNRQTGKWEDTVDVQVIFGYPGLLDLSFRTRMVKAVHADVVWAADEFSFEYGSDAHLRHRPKGGPRKEGESPLYAYMHATLTDGQAFEVMPYSDVLSTRDKSQGYRAALAKRAEAIEKGRRLPPAWTEAPWVKFEIPMARKTAFRQGSKWLPRSVEFAAAVAIDEAADRKRHMDFGPVLDAPTIDGRADYLSAAAEAVTADDDDTEGMDPRDVDSGGGSGQTDPGAAFTDRRPGQTAARSEPPQRQVQTRQGPTIEHDRETHPPQGRTPPAQGRAATPPGPTAPPAESTPFEAMLLDAYGEVAADGQVFTDPQEFAHAYAAVHEDTPPDMRAALAEHNEAAVEEAREASTEAADIIAALGPDRTATVFVPQTGTGKPHWSGWIANLRTHLADLSPDELPDWLENQQATMRNAPPAQRMIAVRAVNDAFAQAGLTPASWVGEMAVAKGQTPAPSQTSAAPRSDPPDAGTPDAGAPRPDAGIGSAAKTARRSASARAQSDPTPATGQADSSATAPKPPDAGEAPVRDADERWVIQRETELSALAQQDPPEDARRQVYALVHLSAVQNKMARLKREKPALFTRAESAFTAALDTLNARIATGDEDGPPPSDPDDPGPDAD